MKKYGILNSEIAFLLARLGHTDTIVIADCGLPIPEGVQRIDLALKQGVPSFYETLEAVLDDFEVEQALFAQEITDHNRSLHDMSILQLKDVKVDYCTHEKFKQSVKQAKAVIRTGETTPYANVILTAGVLF
ncbi:D-ribose pyranase [Aureibacillus halotolerans]|uniref:D-ribose pyranase n=1 Tax=Aureibacillus halotolerans TaxID=1508390 RepID=A0A4R6TPZ0_9BACI|nr:D-ribose pyranase [Aureibacillus halotolerans]TDQ32163.1 ribose transport protein RbsD [Aureibacillus halotolerans]